MSSQAVYRAWMVAVAFLISASQCSGEKTGDLTGRAAAPADVRVRDLSFSSPIISNVDAGDLGIRLRRGGYDGAERLASAICLHLAVVLVCRVSGDVGPFSLTPCARDQPLAEPVCAMHFSSDLCGVLSALPSAESGF